MQISKHIIKSVLFLLIIGAAKANAWTPCMPFCASCEASQIAKIGITAGKNTGKIVKGEAELLKALSMGLGKTLAQGALEGYTAYGEFFFYLQSEVHTTSKAIKSSIELRDENRTRLMDYQLEQIKEKIRNVYTVGSVNHTENSFSGSAQPTFGSLGNKRSESFGKSYKAAQALREELLTQQMDYLNSGSTSVSNTLQIQKLLNNEKYQNFKGDNAFNPSYETLDFESLQHVLSSTFLESPLPADTSAMQAQSGAANKRELERRRYINMLAVIMSGVNEAMVSRQILAETDWIDAYALAPSVDGEISEYENNASLVKGRVSSPGWYLQVKKLNPVGLQRLQSYLLAEENTLRYLADRTRTAYINTLGTMALVTLEQNAENFR